MRKITLMTWTILAGMLIFTVSARSQDGGPTEVLIDTAEIEHEGIDEGVAASEDLISVNLVDVPVSDVVRYFARVAGVSIITGKNVDDKVTVNLVNAEWKPALEEILRTADLMLAERTAP